MALHQTLPTPPRPLSRLALETLLTGFTITGQPGAFGAVMDVTRGVVPAGPYTITDGSGAVVATAEHYHFAKLAAIRAWRERCEASEGLTLAAVAKQEALKVQIAALEVQAAALECQVKAIDAEHGDDVWFLDNALLAYDTVCEAYLRARHHAEQAQDRADDAPERAA